MIKKCALFTLLRFQCMKSIQFDNAAALCNSYLLRVLFHIEFYHERYHMSRFKVAVFILFGCWISPLLMGMDLSEKKPVSTKNNYLSEDIQKLMLFKNADVKDKYGHSLPADVKRLVVQNGCDMYCDHIVSMVQFYETGVDIYILNHQDRMSMYQGAEIKLNDFELITMNEEGRNLFSRLGFAVPQRSNNGTFVHFYPTDYAYENNIKNNLCALLSQNDYNEMLDLPIELRRKVGELCTVKVAGSKVSHTSIMEVAKHSIYCGILAGMFARTVGIMFNLSSADLFYSYINLYIGYGLAASFIFDFYRTRKNELEYLNRYGAKIILIERPLITSEEKEVIKEEKLKLIKLHKILMRPRKNKQLKRFSLPLSKASQLDSLQLKLRE